MGKLKEKVEDEFKLYLDIFYENVDKDTLEDLPEKFELTDEIIRSIWIGWKPKEEESISLKF